LEYFLAQSAPYVLHKDDTNVIDFGGHSVEGSKGFQSLQLWLALLKLGKKDLVRHMDGSERDWEKATVPRETHSSCISEFGNKNIVTLEAVDLNGNYEITLRGSGRRLNYSWTDKLRSDMNLIGDMYRAPPDSASRMLASFPKVDIVITTIKHHLGFARSSGNPAYIKFNGDGVKKELSLHPAYFDLPEYQRLSLLYYSMKKYLRHQDDAEDDKSEKSTDGVYPEGNSALDVLSEQRSGDADSSRTASLNKTLTRFLSLLRGSRIPVGQELSETERKAVWSSVTSLHEEDIEILIPGSVILDNVVNEAVRSIKERMEKKGKRFEVVRYRKETLLEGLAVNASKTKRMVLTDEETSEYLRSALRGGGVNETAEILRNVRFLNLATIAGHSGEGKRIIFQADMLMTAVFLRAVDKEQRSYGIIKNFLAGRLDGRFVGGIDPAFFVDRMAVTEYPDTDPEQILDRVKYFIAKERALNLVTKLEMELFALREFWTFA
jgi:uncharacterized protein (DUF1810 family)